MKYLEIAGVAVGLLYLYFEYKASVWLWLTGIIMPAIYISVYFSAGFYADMGINVYYLAAGFYGWALWLGKGRGKKLRSYPQSAAAEQGAASYRKKTDMIPLPAGMLESTKTYVPDISTDYADENYNAVLSGNDQKEYIGLQELSGEISVQNKGGEKITLSVAGGSSGTFQGNSSGSESDRMEDTLHASTEATEAAILPITRTPVNAYMPLMMISAACFVIIAFILIKFTDSTVPYGDSFTTALSIAGLWMLAKKYVEQWLVWIAVDVVSSALYLYKELYPTAILYGLYSVIAVFGYFKWLKMMNEQKVDN